MRHGKPDPDTDPEIIAEGVDYFVGLLRGRPPDPEGPPLELYPSAGQVRRALQRRTDALDAVRDA